MHAPMMWRLAESPLPGKNEVIPVNMVLAFVVEQAF
jgi:hypothetical protein